VFFERIARVLEEKKECVSRPEDDFFFPRFPQKTLWKRTDAKSRAASALLLFLCRVISKANGFFFFFFFFFFFCPGGTSTSVLFFF
jgi:hypothetical protein